MTSLVSPLYFIAFVLVTQFVLVNLVVAVLLKKLEVCRSDHETTKTPFSCLRIHIKQSLLLLMMMMMHNKH